MAKPKKSSKASARGSARRNRSSTRGRDSSRESLRLTTWETLFGRAEALRRGADHFHVAMRGAPAAVAPTGQVDALIGIWWSNPTFPIFHDLIVNHVPLGVGSGTGGEVIVPVVLRRGQKNSIAWSIHHFVGDTGQGWKHRMFIKFDDQVIELESATDPSTSEDDDVTVGQKTVDVPA